MTAITPELRQAIEQAGDAPARLVDPETNTTYVLLREESFRALTSPIDWSGQLSREEQDGILREMGASIGWDDPDMDIYNDLDPRTP